MAKKPKPDVNSTELVLTITSVAAPAGMDCTRVAIEVDGQLVLQKAVSAPFVYTITVRPQE